MASKFKQVIFCWVPAHVGIDGNEAADSEARNAANLECAQMFGIPHSDMKGPIKSYIFRKWQERWESPLLANNKKYKKVRSTIDFWPSSCHPNRRYEKVLTRLRIGHTRLTHKFLLGRGDAPECDHCRTLLTVEHILVHCGKYRDKRHKYHLDGRSIEEILNENVILDKLMGFLKEINLFYEI